MGNLQVRFLEGWAPAMAPGYSANQVYLEPLEERHADELFAIGQNEAMWRYMPREPMTSEDDALEFVRAR
jgi:hypothetical protein